MPIREHLYKAKRKDNGEWVKGDLVTYKNGDCYIFVEELTGALHGYFVDPETVCECTGIPDKNGAEIFEGDIAITKTTSSEFVGCISYSTEYVRFVCTTKSKIPYPMDKRFEYEVIGNIYDNPELLEVEA